MTNFTDGPSNMFTLVKASNSFYHNGVAFEFEHNQSGMRHTHIDYSGCDLACLIGIHTPAHDDSGAAHILEHMVLSGSARYNDDNLFFTVNNNSMRTYMSAFTKVDWTGFPFVCKRHDEFFHLLDIYLDSIFYPTLKKKAFAREGFTIERGALEKPKAELSSIKGVVFNEMLGSSVSSTEHMWSLIAKHLYSGSPSAHKNSGAPDKILNSSHEKICDYHRSHYTPENTVLMTSGKIDIGHIHSFIHQLIPNSESIRTRRLKPNNCVPHTGYTSKEITHVIADCPYDKAIAAHGNRLVIGWKLGFEYSLVEHIEHLLISDLLLTSYDSPLSRSLANSKIGTGFSPLCGLENTYPQAAFLLGLDGCNSSSCDSLEVLVQEVLARVVKSGFTSEAIETALMNIEFKLRLVQEGDIPYCIRILFMPMMTALRGGDVSSFFSIQDSIDEVRKRCLRKSYVSDLIKRKLLENSNRVCITFRPDEKFEETYNKTIHESMKRSANSATSLNDQEYTKPKATSERVDSCRIRKYAYDSFSTAFSPIACSSTSQLTEMPFKCYEANIAGLALEKVLCDISSLKIEQYYLLPIATEIAIKKITSSNQHRKSYIGQLYSQFEHRSCLSATDKAYSTWAVTAKTLNPLFLKNTVELHNLLNTTPDFNLANFTNTIRDYLASRRSDFFRQSHIHTMCAASSHFSLAAKLSHFIYGFGSSKLLRDNLLCSTHGRHSHSGRKLSEFVDEIMFLYQSILDTNKQHLLVFDERTSPGESSIVRLKRWVDIWGTKKEPAPTPNHLSLVESNRRVERSSKSAWLTTDGRNCCVKAYQTVPPSHSDSSSLTVLAIYLNNYYLHDAIRTRKGAYSAGSGHDASNGVFHFFTYQDPSPFNSMAEFDRALDWLNRDSHSCNAIEQSKLLSLRRLKLSLSPIQTIEREFSNLVYMRSYSHRKQYRERLLSTTLKDMRRVAESYLREQPYSNVLLSNEKEYSSLQKKGYKINFMY